MSYARTSYDKSKDEDKPNGEKNTIYKKVLKEFNQIDSYVRDVAMFNLEPPQTENEYERRKSSLQNVLELGKYKMQALKNIIRMYSNEQNLSPMDKSIRAANAERLKLKYKELNNCLKKCEREFYETLELHDRPFHQQININKYKEYIEEKTFERNKRQCNEISSEKVSINIYDYSMADHKKSTNYDSYKTGEFQSIDSSVQERWRKKNKKYKKSLYNGKKKDEISEYLLQDVDSFDLEMNTEDDNIDEKEKKHHGKLLQEDPKEFVSVNTVDIESEILQQKNKEIQKLHMDLINIQELYKELSEQINIQGENIDHIDSHIVNTHGNIILSGREIEIARDRYSRGFKCTFYLFFIILFLIIFILILYKVI